MTRPSPSPRASRGAVLWSLLALATAALWVWSCWARFPNRGWNDVRLAPLFALKLDGAMYPGEFGATSTWMYGPLHLLLLWPVTWAQSAYDALLVGGALNAALSLGAILMVCLAWPTPQPLDRSRRLGAAAVVILLWPAASWLFLQADSTSVAVGLIANLALVRWPGPRGRWAAALLATATMLGKQTSLAVPLAQLLWIGGREGWRAAGHHALRLAGAGGSWGLLLLAGHDVRDLWFNLIATPGQLPWTDEPAKRVIDLAPYLAVHLGLPALGWLAWRAWDRGAVSTGSLPLLAWACSWPLGLAAMLKIGGSINVLQGLQLWLPAGLVITCALVASRPAPRAWLGAGLAAVAVILCAWRFALEPIRVLRPDPRIYQEAVALAEQHRGRVWFPWHPLVTVFSDQRRYLDEDGLLVRFLAGNPVDYATARAHLPPEFDMLVLRRDASDWGIAEGIIPADSALTEIGAWRVRTWARPTGQP